MKSRWILTLAVLIAIGSFVGCAGAMSFSYDATVTITYLGGDAGFNNEFGVSSPAPASLGFGHATPAFTVFDIGTLPKGTDLVLYITNPNGNTFFSEGANPDGISHAIITDHGDGTYTIGFEDQLNGGDKDYNDIQLLVTVTETTIPVPEFPTPAIVIGSLFGIIGAVFAVRSRFE